ncbi:hypothetical protein [Cupriavidus sp. IDO]|uniref:hypothetical protein n=1 Tax=Cupriavidus sp. IDO TaxID=1539142 RepID=UPI0009E3FCC0|nr:hypothetical protein [Cupriavidus sp. IDO]
MKHSCYLIAIAAGAAALSVAQGALAREYVEGQAPAYVEPAHRPPPPRHVPTGWHGDRYYDGHRWWEREEWNKRHHHHDDNHRHDDDHHH